MSSSDYKAHEHRQILNMLEKASKRLNTGETRGMSLTRIANIHFRQLDQIDGRRRHKSYVRQSNAIGRNRLAGLMGLYRAESKILTLLEATLQSGNSDVREPVIGHIRGFTGASDRENLYTGIEGLTASIDETRDTVAEELVFLDNMGMDTRMAMAKVTEIMGEDHTRYAHAMLKTDPHYIGLYADQLDHEKSAALQKISIGYMNTAQLEIAFSVAAARYGHGHSACNKRESALQPDAHMAQTLLKNARNAIEQLEYNEQLRHLRYEDMEASRKLPRPAEPIKAYNHDYAIGSIGTESCEIALKALSQGLFRHALLNMMVDELMEKSARAGDATPENTVARELHRIMQARPLAVLDIAESHAQLGSLALSMYTNDLIENYEAIDTQRENVAEFLTWADRDMTACSRNGMVLPEAVHRWGALERMINEGPARDFGPMDEKDCGLVGLNINQQIMTAGTKALALYEEECRLMIGLAAITSRKGQDAGILVAQAYESFGVMEQIVPAMREWNGSVHNAIAEHEHYKKQYVPPRAQFN